VLAKLFFLYINNSYEANLWMSEFWDSAHAEFCTELADVCRIGRRVQN